MRKWEKVWDLFSKMNNPNSLRWRVARDEVTVEPAGQNMRGIQKNTLKSGVFRSMLPWLTKSQGLLAGERKKLNLWPSTVEYYLQLPLPVHCTDQVIKRPSQTTTKEQLSTSYVLNLLSAKDMRDWGWALSAKFRKLGCHVQPDNMTLWVANLIAIKRKSSQKKISEYCTLI